MRQSRISGVGLTVLRDIQRLEDLAQGLDELEMQDLDFVELPIFVMDVIIGGRIIPHRLRMLKRICSNRPFGFTVHGPLSVNFKDKTHIEIQRKVCRAVLEVSAEIGARHVVHHDGPIQSINPQVLQEALEHQAKHLYAAGDEAQKLDQIICVETMFGNRETAVCSPAELAAHLAQINHPNVRSTIDFSHSAIRCAMKGTNYLEEIRELAPYAAHLHMHDSFGLPQTMNAGYFEARMYNQGDLHLPIGWGNLDFDALALLPYPPGTTLNLETYLDNEHNIAAARRFQKIANEANASSS